MASVAGNDTHKTFSATFTAAVKRATTYDSVAAVTNTSREIKCVFFKVRPREKFFVARRPLDAAPNRKRKLVSAQRNLGAAKILFTRQRFPNIGDPGNAFAHPKLLLHKRLTQ